MISEENVAANSIWHQLAAFGSPELAERFLQQVNVKEQKDQKNPFSVLADQSAPITEAIRNRNYPMVQYLLEKMKVSFRYKNLQEENLLHQMLRYNFAGDKQAVPDEKFMRELFLNYPGMLDEPNKQGETPLIKAMMNGNVVALRFFVENGAAYYPLNGLSVMAAFEKMNMIHTIQAAALLLVTKRDKHATQLSYEDAIKLKENILKNLSHMCHRDVAYASTPITLTKEILAKWDLPMCVLVLGCSNQIKRSNMHMEFALTGTQNNLRQRIRNAQPQEYYGKPLKDLVQIIESFKPAMSSSPDAETQNESHFARSPYVAVISALGLPICLAILDQLGNQISPDLQKILLSQIQTVIKKIESKSDSTQVNADLPQYCQFC